MELVELWMKVKFSDKGYFSDAERKYCSFDAYSAKEHAKYLCILGELEIAVKSDVHFALLIFRIC